MLTLTRRVAAYEHAWQAVPCRTCNAEIGRHCDMTVFTTGRDGTHAARVEYAELLGFRETRQAAMELGDGA